MSNSTTTTSSDGCVVCPTTPSCPTCADDEYCVMTSLTCNKCPTTYCSPRSSGQFNSLNNSTSISSSNSGNGNGHITKVVVGSVIGGIAGLLIIVMILIYQWYWKPRRRRNKLQLKDRMDAFDEDDEDDFTDDDENEDEDDILHDEHDIYDSTEELRNRDSVNNGIALENEALDELTSLNDYSMKKSRRGKGIVQLRDLSNHSSTNNLQKPNSSLHSSHTNESNDLLRRSMLVPGNRQSSASTIRTNSSNVLPIAYIPGVTSSSNARSHRPNNGNNSRFNHNFGNGSGSNLNIVGDTGSHITLGSSILGGLDEDFDAMSIMMDRHNNNNNIMRENVQQQDHIDGGYNSANDNTGIDYDREHDDIGTMDTDMQSAMDTSLGTIKIGLGNNLMTAIKAKPKLIQINEEDDNNTTSNATSKINTLEQYELDTFDDSHAIELQSIENGNDNDDDDDDDDNGSFLLDVEMPTSLHNEQMSNRSSLPTSQIHSSLDPNVNSSDNIPKDTQNDKDTDDVPSIADSNFKSPFDDAFELESD